MSDLSGNGKPAEAVPWEPMGLLRAAVYQFNVDESALSDGRKIVLMQIAMPTGCVGITLEPEKARLVATMLTQAAARVDGGLVIGRIGDIPPAPPS